VDQDCGIKPTLASTDPFARYQFKSTIAQPFKVDSGPLTLLLGMQVIRDRNARTVEIRQTAYIDQLPQKLSMTEYKPAATPVECVLCRLTHGQPRASWEVCYARLRSLARHRLDATGAR
jgi:hypothetical protein